LLRFAGSLPVSRTLPGMNRRWIMARAGGALLALTLVVPATRATGQQPEPTDGPVIEIVEHDSFRWGDAAIGALAGVGAIFLGAGVIVVVASGRRLRRKVNPTAADELNVNTHSSGSTSRRPAPTARND
jgi:hypothetical protein